MTPAELQTGVQAIIDGACERDPEFAKRFQEVMHHASSLPCLQTPPREGDSGTLLPPLRMVAPLEDSLGAEAVRQGELGSGLSAVSRKCAGDKYANSGSSGCGCCTPSAAVTVQTSGRGVLRGAPAKGER